MKKRLRKWFCNAIFIVCIALLGFPAMAREGNEPLELEPDINDLSKRVAQLENEKKRSSKSSSKKPKKDMQTYWKEGTKFEYKKDGIKIQFGGRIQNDWIVWTGNANAKAAYGSGEVATEFRRARLFISGTLYDHIVFKGQYDFADGPVNFKDVYIGGTKLPYIGTFLVGHQKEPFSLEELTSSKYMTFAERALPNVFAPSRNTGFAMYNHYNKRVAYALGAFKDSDNQGEGLGSNNWAITGRLSGTPVYSDGGRTLVHLGGAFSYRWPDGDTVRYRQRPEHHLAPRFLDIRNPITGMDIATDGIALFGAEAAVVLGPFSAQMEYMGSLINGTTPGLGDAYFQGLYAYASYFLTGEHRPYKTSRGTFGRVKPKKVFMDGNGGFGAVEIGGRFSWLDLQDGNYQPLTPPLATASFGTLYGYTAVINWHLNPMTRITSNFSVSDPDPNGLAYLWTTRFQIEF